jgi:hypothetical protein
MPLGTLRICNPVRLKQSHVAAMLHGFFYGILASPDTSEAFASMVLSIKKIR